MSRSELDQSALNESLVDACEAGNLAEAKKRLDAGANVNCQVQTMSHYAGGLSGMEPLLGACKSGNVELVAFLLDHGANIDTFVWETEDEGISDFKMVATDTKLDAAYFGRFHPAVLELLAARRAAA